MTLSEQAKEEQRYESVRPPAVAGSFYPAMPSQLTRVVSRLLEYADRRLPDCPKLLIVPHAGYAYSGLVAASAYVNLVDARHVRRVVLVGPSHHFTFDGVAVTRMQAFATPLGLVPVARGACDALAQYRCVRLWEPPHETEHSLEVQLPFLQHTLGEFDIVPLVVGQACTQELVELLQTLWGGTETLVVLTTDLSHYLDYEQAAECDATTVQAIQTLQYEWLGPEHACGWVALRGLLCFARQRNISILPLMVLNSGDSSGPRSRVVGYGAFASVSRNNSDERSFSLADLPD